MAPGAMKALQLVVPDAAVARQELLDRGVETSELSVITGRAGLPCVENVNNTVHWVSPQRERTGRSIVSDGRESAWTVASFEDSLTPMLVADDRRRYVAVNRAMCLLLRSDRETVLQMSLDDLTPPEFRAGMEQVWEAFIAEGVQSGAYELVMPDGPRMLVEYSATANVEPGRHLAIFVVPPSSDALVLLEQSDTRQLSIREREVLARVAMGESGATIASVLGISPATVEAHVRSCLLKLEAKNRAHAIALGLQRGEIAMNFGSPES